MPSMTIPASEVAEGDFIPGLDHGYVIEAENDVECSAFEGRYNVALGSFTVLTFNDADGGENYILLAGDIPVTVERA